MDMIWVLDVGCGSEYFELMGVEMDVGEIVCYKYMYRELLAWLLQCGWLRSHTVG
jgi:hypothetical protein